MVKRREFGWLVLALGLWMTGCKRVPLTPPVTPLLGWQGLWDGQGFEVGGDLSMGIDSTAGATTHWVQWTGSDEEVWQVRLHIDSGHLALDWETGSWPWVAEGAAMTWLGDADFEDGEGVWTLQGVTQPAGAQEAWWTWTAEDTLSCEFESVGPCEQRLTFQLFPRDMCQTDWLDEPFSMSYDDGEWKLNPPAWNQEAAWVWHVDGVAYDTTWGNAHVHIPSSQIVDVGLEPLDDQGPFGGFWIHRRLDFGEWGGSWGGCEVADVELDREDELHWWIELRRQVDGVWWSSVRACDDVPEGIWQCEVTSVSPESLLSNGWRAIELQLDVVLPMSHDALGWHVLEANGLVVPLPIGR